MLIQLLIYCGFALAAQASPGFGPAHASSERASNRADLAIDGDAKTAWCAAREAKAGPDWWDVELDHATVGAIHMKSGYYDGHRLSGHKIREFVWSYQRAGDATWHDIAETDTHANRYQLILRFPAVHDVVRLRLTVGARSADELKILGSNNPCLRSVELAADTNARFETHPWFWATATWEEGANIFNPLLHFDWEAFHVRDALQNSMRELERQQDPDVVDELWVGQINEPWVTAEPAPAAFLLSGNYKNYVDVNADTYRGFYDFVRGEGARIPMLGACGGHQLLAMAYTHPTFDDFRTEFSGYADTMSQTVITCSTNPAYGCNGRTAEECCYEGGAVHPFRHLTQNIAGFAMPNAFQSSRDDMLFNLLPASKGFEAFLYHSDYVDAEKVAPWFDVIATYPADVQGLSARHPTLTQAMKVRGKPIYGTQFHFDENFSGDCHRAQGHRDMDRVLRNFELIALNRLNDPAAFTTMASSNGGDVGNLFDLDRASAWCSDSPDGELTLEFKTAVPLKALVTVEGETARDARAQSLAYEISNNGRDWQPLFGERRSLHAIQDACGGRSGHEDGQSVLTTFDGPTRRARYLRVHLKSRWKKPCLRELMLLNL